MTFTLTSFQQGRFLDATDPETRDGVCVALCDLWLKSLFEAPGAAPRQRVQALAVDFSRAEAHQRRYGRLRDALGRDDARRHMGARIGIDYAEQTFVDMQLHAGRQGMRRKVADDLREPGAAATWTMRFSGGGGHAIAGINRIEPRPYGLEFRIHIFDPNLGEYAGDYGSCGAIIEDLVRRIPLYATTAIFHRTAASGTR